MWNAVKNLFTGKSSRDVAKGRLHLAAVIGKYVPIDVDAVEIHIEKSHSRQTQLKVSSVVTPRNA
jgi:septum formation topological specificity factor MinE